MRDGKNDDALIPQHVSDVVFTETGCQIYPAHTASADIVQERVTADFVARLQVTKFKGGGNLRINACIVLDAVVVLLLSRRMYLLGHYGR